MSPTTIYPLGAIVLALSLVCTGCNEEADTQNLSPEAAKARQEIKQAEDQEGKQIDALVRGDSGASITFPKNDGPILDLRISAEEDELQVGERQTLTLEVTNRSDQALRNLELRPQLSANFQIDGISRSRGSSDQQQQPQPQQQQQQQEQQQRQSDALSGEHPTLRLASLDPEQTVTYSIDGVATDAGVVKATFDIDYDNQAMAVVAFKAVQPDLELERELLVDGTASERIYACDQAVLRYRLVNRGSGAARGVVVSENLPANARTEDGQGQVSLRVEELASGDTWSTEIPLRLDGSFAWDSRASASQGERTVHSQRLQAVVMEPRADIQVQAPQQVEVGQSAEVAVRIRNTGEHPIADAAVVLPEHDLLRRASLHGLSQGSIEDGRIALGEIAPGDTHDFSLRLEPTQPGRVEGEIALDAHCVEAQSHPISIEVLGVPALQVEVIDADDPIAVGGQTSYRIRVTNEGTAAAEQVSISAQLTQHLELLGLEGAEGEGEIQRDGDRLVLPTSDQLAPGESREWVLQAKAREAGQGGLQLQIASAIGPDPITEVEPTTIQ